MLDMQQGMCNTGNHSVGSLRNTTWVIDGHHSNASQVTLWRPRLEVSVGTGLLRDHPPLGACSLDSQGTSFSILDLPSRVLLCILFVTELSEQVIYLNPFEHRNTAPVSVCVAWTIRGARAALKSTDGAQLTMGADIPLTSAAVTLLEGAGRSYPFQLVSCPRVLEALVSYKARSANKCLESTDFCVRPGQGAASMALAQPRSLLGCAF